MIKVFLLRLEVVLKWIGGGQNLHVCNLFLHKAFCKDGRIHRLSIYLYIHIYSYMYLCIYLYIWLLKYKSFSRFSATRVFRYFCIHVGKMLLLIWQYSYNRRTESLLDVFFMLVNFTLWELHDIRRIENSVEEKMGIKKIGENDINLWLHSLRPLLLFCHSCHELLPPS